jgi:hypothetical protein
MIFEIHNNRITDPVGVRTFFDALPDGKWSLSVKSADQRSLSQNKYYWSVVCSAVKCGLQDMGWDTIITDEDAHEFLKDKFLKVTHVNEETGEAITITRSTTILSKTEFKEYVERCVRFAAMDLHIVISDPE